MKEVEVKILEINKKDVESKLRKLGAKKDYDGAIVDYYFDTPSKLLRKKHLIFRLRKKDNCNELTLKQKKASKGVKKRNEYQTTVSDFNEIKDILELLGYKLTSKFEKHRISYDYKDVHFDIDTPKEKNIPSFLEIESNNTKTVEKYIKLLGYKMSETFTYDYKDIIDLYSEKKSKK